MAGATGLASLADVASIAARLDRDFPVRGLAIGAGVITCLPETIERSVPGTDGDLVVLADDVEHDGADGPVKPAVTGLLNGGRRRTREVTLRNAGRPVHATEATIEQATRRCRGATALVTVGSGTVTDIGKLVGDRLDIPHVVVQTAASVNGFTNNQSVMLVAGVKRTRPSRWPVAVVIDTDVVARAPDDLNRAGVGDLLSMFTAPADWLLASAAGLGPSYEGALVDIVRPHGDALLELAPGLGAGDPHGVETLARLLSLSGFSIGIAGSTAPSSGLEHLISHLLDSHTIAHGLEPSLHGLQAGLGAVAAAAVWARLRAAVGGSTLPPLRLPDSEAARIAVLDAFAHLGEDTALECWAGYEAKLTSLADGGLERIRRQWVALQGDLDRLLMPPEQLALALRLPDGPASFAALPTEFDAPTVKWAIAHGHQMRDRFVVSDLAELLGMWTEDFVDEILADLDVLGVLA